MPRTPGRFSGGSRPTSSRAAWSPAASTRAARTRCPRTTATASSSTSRPRTSGTRATALLVETVWPHVVKAADYIDALRQAAPHRRVPDRREAALLRPPSGIHQPRGVLLPARALLLGRLLRRSGASPTPRGSRGRSARPRRGSPLRGVGSRDARRRARVDPRGDRREAASTSSPAPRTSATSTRLRRRSRSIRAESRARLPAVELARTFDIYWERFQKRASNRRAAGNEYTPYEWRVAGSFVRLGRRDRAQALFDFFMADRRPPGWNHWAEVVWNEPRMPKFIGDMPHGWVGSDFLRSFLDLFAYEGAGGSLVLGAGLPPVLAPRRGRRRRPGAAHALRHARRLRRAGGRRRAVPDRRDGEAAGGFVAEWPLEGRPSDVLVDGRPVARALPGRVTVPSAPAEILMRGPRS